MTSNKVSLDLSVVYHTGTVVKVNCNWNGLTPFSDYNIGQDFSQILETYVTNSFHTAGLFKSHTLYSGRGFWKVFRFTDWNFSSTIQPYTKQLGQDCELSPLSQETHNFGYHFSISWLRNWKPPWLLFKCRKVVFWKCSKLSNVCHIGKEITQSIIGIYLSLLESVTLKIICLSIITIIIPFMCSWV